MTGILVKSTARATDRITSRRAFLGALGAGGALLALPGCAGGFGGYSLVDAVQRMLFLASERAFARMLQGDGFWDSQVAQLGLGNVLGTRGDVLSRILTSALFKSRLEHALGDIAYEGAARAAPLVTDAVRVIGIRNAIDLVRGSPTAATSFLRGSMGSTLIEAMVPELGQAMRVAQEPLVEQLLSAATGVDVAGVATRLATSVEDVIWQEIGREEAAIRANPEATRDPLIIDVFGGGARY